MNAYMLLNLSASIVPDQEIVTFESRRQNYSQLVDNTGRLAAALAEKGIRHGDRVGLITTNCPEMVETFFAAFQLGAVVVPINYRAKSDELAFMIQDAGVNVLIVEQRYADLVMLLLENTGVDSAICIGEAHAIGPSMEEIKQQVEQPMLDFSDVEDDELAVLLYTSGTTSRPKGVMITHGQLTSYVMNHSEAPDGTERGSSIVCLPGYHVAGATSICNSIYSGRRLILLRQFDAEAWLFAVENEQATQAFLVPTMLKRVMDHPDFNASDLNSLTSLSYGAAPMPLPVIQQAIDLFPAATDFSNGFGLTETTSTVSVLDAEDHKLTGTKEEVEKKIKRLASVGKPLPGVDIMILDEGGNEAETNIVGQVYVRTGRSMKGYWNRPDASSETMVDGWVNTKDMGWLDEDGYLFLGGRSSDMIIRGGENISPAEVEGVLFEHPLVADIAVIGYPSLEWGEEVMAVIVPENPEVPPEKEEIISYCRGRLSSFKRPSIIKFTHELPRTSTGKILKRKLRSEYVKQ